MWRISVYIISIILVVSSLPQTGLSQDTIQFPLKFRLGLEVAGPLKYFNNKDLLNIEGSFSSDLNEKFSAIIIAGHTNYTFSKYRDSSFLMYDYRSKGFFFRAGFDVNLLKPEKSQGKYSIGIGIRYGISHFKYEIPAITSENYWGRSVTSVPTTDEWAHYIEFTPGVRAELFKNFSMGWTVSLRKMIDPGTGRHLKPVYLPGYGNGAKSFSPGFNYFIIWSISFKKKQIIILPEPEEEEDVTGPNQNPGNTNQGGFRQ